MSGLLGWLFSLPWWASLVIIAVLLIGIVEIGFRIGRCQSDVAAKRSSEIAALVAALITLLGLLLGFSFSMVESRFANRQAIIIDEANAIGTAYLRAELLPEPQSTRIQGGLRTYVDLRLQARRPEVLEEAIRASQSIHDDLWAEASVVATANPESEVIGRFLSALNEVIDLHTTRVTVGLYQRIPKTIMLVLLLISTFAMLLVGYWSGLEDWRARLAIVCLVASIALAIVMINKIDSPGTPMVEATHKAMADLQLTMSKDR